MMRAEVKDLIQANKFARPLVDPASQGPQPMDIGAVGAHAHAHDHDIDALGKGNVEHHAHAPHTSPRRARPTGAISNAWLQQHRWPRDAPPPRMSFGAQESN